MVGSNLPDDVTPGDVDRAMDGPDEPREEPEPERPHCAGCGAPLPWSAAHDDRPVCGDGRCKRRPDDPDDEPNADPRLEDGHDHD